MFFQLTEEDILKVCTQCEHHDDGYCKKEDKLVAELRRCTVWNDFYREKCVRQR